MIAHPFCVGNFSQKQTERNTETIDPPRVFIEQLKTKMNIAKNRNDIEIFLNGDENDPRHQNRCENSGLLKVS
jgi:hypothetical protein